MDFDSYVAPSVIATDEVDGFHYPRVVLRPDQLDLIREIIRDEIAASRAKGGIW